MSLAKHREQAASKKAPATSSSGDRIKVIDADGEDPKIAELVIEHYHGKLLEKDAKKHLMRAGGLKREVLERTLDTRTAERPKQFKFTAALPGGQEHVVTINVRENGYASFDEPTRAKLVDIVGEEFLDVAVTQTTHCTVDFSLVPEDMHEEVYEHLMKVNEMCGSEGKPAEIVDIKFMNVPKTTFHEERTKLNKRLDRELEKIVPTSVAFGR